MHTLQLRCRRHRRLFLCDVKVAHLVSNQFFMCKICDTNSSCIQTTDPHLINMLVIFLIWFVVVLLLLQTMQHRHRCCFRIFFGKKKILVKNARSFLQILLCTTHRGERLWSFFAIVLWSINKIRDHREIANSKGYLPTVSEFDKWSYSH